MWNRTACRVLILQCLLTATGRKGEAGCGVLVASVRLACLGLSKGSQWVLTFSDVACGSGSLESLPGRAVPTNQMSPPLHLIATEIASLRCQRTMLAEMGDQSTLGISVPQGMPSMVSHRPAFPAELEFC